MVEYLIIGPLSYFRARARYNNWPCLVCSPDREATTTDRRLGRSRSASMGQKESAVGKLHFGRKSDPRFNYLPKPQFGYCAVGGGEMRQLMKCSKNETTEPDDRDWESSLGPVWVCCCFASASPIDPIPSDTDTVLWTARGREKKNILKKNDLPLPDHPSRMPPVSFSRFFLPYFFLPYFFLSPFLPGDLLFPFPFRVSQTGSRSFPCLTFPSIFVGRTFSVDSTRLVNSVQALTAFHRVSASLSFSLSRDS